MPLKKLDFINWKTNNNQYIHQYHSWPKPDPKITRLSHVLLTSSSGYKWPLRKAFKFRQMQAWSYPCVNKNQINAQVAWSNLDKAGPDKKVS